MPSGPNHPLRRARLRLPSPQRRGERMSASELATAVNDRLHRADVLDADIDAKYISRLEDGYHHWMRDHRRRWALRAVLQVASDADLGLHPHRRSSRDDNLSITEGQPANPINPRVDRHTVLEHLRQQWHLLVQADNLFGPQNALVGVRTQLTLIEGLLNDDDGDSQEATVAVAAQYAESAAWLYQELGQAGEASRWAGQALVWAHQLGHMPMVAWSLYRRSQQQLFGARPRDAVDLVRAARRHDHELPGPMRAAICVQEAHALAALGLPESLTVLDVALRWASDDYRGDAAAGHGSFCTPGYIEIHRATCLGLLGRHLEAIRVFDEALPAVPAVYRRDRAAALASKAAAHAAAGEPDIAAATALTALGTARPTGSRRIVRQIDAVAGTLKKQRGIEPVEELLALLVENG